MKLKRKMLAVFGGAVFAAALPFIIFHARKPVLIVTELIYMQLYGESRIRNETLLSSLALFRRILVVTVADEAGFDIVQFAITEVSSSPYCVLFPLRFARSAGLYREKNPQIPVVLLGSTYGEDSIFSDSEVNVNDYFFYKTDIYSDFYKAGRAAAALGMGKEGKIAVFLESHIYTPARNAFLQALNDLEEPPEALFFTSFSRFTNVSDLSCVVLAGAGAEFLEKEAGVPIIFVTWTDPALLPYDVALIINDSPWAQAVQAVRMVKIRMNQGEIKSKFYVAKNKNIDREILRKIKKKEYNYIN